MNFMAALCGFVVWFPSLAFINIGNAGLEFAILFIISYLILSGKFCPKILINLIIIIIFVFVQFIYHYFVSEKYELLLKGDVLFLLSILSFLFGYTIVYNSHVNQFISGYINGAWISCVIAILQMFTWSVFGLDLEFISLFSTNRSFSLVANSTDIVDAKRVFSLLPEPSLLAALLIPAIVFKLINKKFFSSIVFTVTLFLTKTVMVVPAAIYLIYLYFADGLKGKLKTLAQVFFIFIFLAPFVFIYNTNDEIFDYTIVNYKNYSGISDRILDWKSSGSLMSRSQSIVNGIDVFSSNVIFGTGVQNDSLRSFLSDNSSQVEINLGINSFLISIFAWFGVFGLYFLWICSTVFKKCSNVFNNKFFFISFLIPAAYSVGYFLFLPLWIATGALLCYKLRD